MQSKCSNVLEQKRESSVGEDDMAKKLSLKPVAAALAKIVKALEVESKKATGARKATIDGEITKIKALIAEVPPACRRYNVG
jgi:hypothetical protein